MPLWLDAILVIVAALIAGGRYLGLHLVRDAGLLLACVSAAALAAWRLASSWPLATTFTACSPNRPTPPACCSASIPGFMTR